MAKGFFNALKGVDAFGKVSMRAVVVEEMHVLMVCVDHGGRQGQDTYRGTL